MSQSLTYADPFLTGSTSSVTSGNDELEACAVQTMLNLLGAALLQACEPLSQTSSTIELHLILAMSLLYRLGLGVSESGLEPAARPGAIILSQFLFNYLITQPRLPKIAYGIDNNANPRPDLAEKGPQAVKEGKISQKQLDRLHRLQAAHNNGLENLPLFSLAICFALIAKVPGSFVNRFGLTYTLARVAYVLNYYYVETEAASRVRTVLWWIGNLSCATTINKAANVYGSNALI
ncbi:hypothetical protein FKW77_004848 [Venturia effusa]|uniref:Uncharacterized protein n=1 Tax=Venturia effusa TaxID=50376 RepID=A0A517KW97_9PEZI|nr:hypothetical protein FKW77_004848 [Venturia effusa]